MNQPTYWRKCTTCKKLISFGQKYWICSVSTCNRVRTDLVFCDLRCFDAHIPVMNHRDAGAFEKRAPAQAAATQTPRVSTHQSATVKLVSNTPSNQTQQLPQPEFLTGSEDEVLVVVSKVKKYIRDQSGMSTSDAVMEVLSKKVRDFADQAITSANAHGRKTVMDRDLLGRG